MSKRLGHRLRETKDFQCLIMSVSLDSRVARVTRGIISTQVCVYTCVCVWFEGGEDDTVTGVEGPTETQVSTDEFRVESPVDEVLRKETGGNLLGRQRSMFVERINGDM